MLKDCITINKRISLALICIIIQYYKLDEFLVNDSVDFINKVFLMLLNFIYGNVLVLIKIFANTVFSLSELGRLAGLPLNLFIHFSKETPLYYPFPLGKKTNIKRPCKDEDGVAARRVR